VKDNSQGTKKSRVKCSYCGRKRYTENMVLVFSHAILSIQDFYCCKEWGGKCAKKFTENVMLYHNTGLLVIEPTKQLNKL